MVRRRGRVRRRCRWPRHWWPRWVERCRRAVRRRGGGWVPMERPLALADRCSGRPAPHGDVLDALVTAGADAWRILRGRPPLRRVRRRVRAPVDQTIRASCSTAGPTSRGRSGSVDCVDGAPAPRACRRRSTTSRLAATREDRNPPRVSDRAPHAPPSRAPERPLAVAYVRVAGARSPTAHDRAVELLRLRRSTTAPPTVRLTSSRVRPRPHGRRVGRGHHRGLVRPGRRPDRGSST